MMASGEQDQKEVEPENKELSPARDPVTEFIRLVVNTILREEEMELVSEMVKYRKNLSQRMFSKLQDLEGKPADMTRFYESFKAGWQKWKKNGHQKEESSFAIFMKSMNIYTDTLSDNPIR